MSDSQELLKLRLSFIDAPYWNEKQLEDFCLGIPPEIKVNRYTNVSFEARSEVERRISEAISAKELNATRNSEAGRGARMYGGVWNIEPAHAVDWVMSQTPPFLEFPEWLVSELQTKHRTQTEARRARGRYTLDEAAQLIVEQEGFGDAGRKELLGNLIIAADDGLLHVRSPNTDVIVRPEAVRHFHEVVSHEDVNNWAIQSGLYWLWDVKLETQVLPVPKFPDAFDFTIVATREKLIEAFGGITKMDMTWFGNLKDAPKLKAARKHKGQGGRNSVGPLFCPFEVMQWLVDPQRKKGKSIDETTAWRRLKSYFPKVYNLHSVGDPNEY